MNYLIILLCFISLAFSEISLSLGQTSGTYLQTLTDDGDVKIHKNYLPGRPALFYEIDSGNHPLWLENDQVIFGIGLMSETRYKDYYADSNFTTFIPIYFNYYLRFAENWAVGTGLNLNIMQTRYKNNLISLSQKPGLNLVLRYTPEPSYFIEAGVMRTVSEAWYEPDLRSSYDATNYILKFGWYLETSKY